MEEASLRPPIWLRYIDDVFTVWPYGADQFWSFVDGLNSLLPRIEFTYELSHHCATFLDLYIYKPPGFVITGRLGFSIHYKPTNTFSYSMGSTYMDDRILKGIAVGETVRLLRNSDSRFKFEREKFKLLKRFKLREFPTKALRAIKSVDYGLREKYLAKRGKRELEKPMPINTLFFQFLQPINRVIKELWKNHSRDPFLYFHLPNAPFLACKNHRSIGRILSHKRRSFLSHPAQSTLQPEAAQDFVFQRFNRPRTSLQRLSSVSSSHGIFKFY